MAVQPVSVPASAPPPSTTWSPRPREPQSPFERLRFDRRRVYLEDLAFQLLERPEDEEPMGGDFVLFKSREFIEIYAELFDELRLRPRTLLELGVWDGGSVAFWFELFQPHKHVAIDLASRGDTEQLRRWRDVRGLEERVKTYWQVDQADGERLRHIVRSEFGQPLDLVIDDASHLHGPTKASFETLFPLLRPGGVYVIEDWGWEHTRHARLDSATFTSPSAFVLDLVQAVGTQYLRTISQLVVFGPLVAAVRGPAELPDPFCLDDRIRRPAAAVD